MSSAIPKFREFAQGTGTLYDPKVYGITNQQDPNREGFFEELWPLEAGASPTYVLRANPNALFGGRMLQIRYFNDDLQNGYAIPDTNPIQFERILIQRLSIRLSAPHVSMMQLETFTQQMIQQIGPTISFQMVDYLSRRMGNRDSTLASFRDYQVLFGSTSVTRFWETDEIKIFSDEDPALVQTDTNPDHHQYRGMPPRTSQQVVLYILYYSYTYLYSFIYIFHSFYLINLKLIDK
jgi:hypothetical protein